MTSTGGSRLPGVVAMWAAGLAVLAAGIAATISADVGVGPLDVASTALVRRLGIDIGLAITVINITMTVAARVIGGRVHAATITTMLAMGPLVDVWMALIRRFPEPSGPAAWVLLLFGIVLVGTGGAVQISSGWGPSPMDALCVAIAGERWSLQRVRTATEFSFAAAGTVGGGALGPGTIVIAAGVGPALGTAMRLLSPLRRRLTRD
jgi:uncharacterized membrane protein YczE